MDLISFLYKITSILKSKNNKINQKQFLSENKFKKMINKQLKKNRIFKKKRCKIEFLNINFTVNQRVITCRYYFTIQNFDNSIT